MTHPMTPSETAALVQRLRTHNLRVILKFIEGELREREDASERASVDIRSAREHHTGRASAFREARTLVAKFDTAARQVLRTKGPKRS